MILVNVKMYKVVEFEVSELVGWFKFMKLICSYV